MPRFAQLTTFLREADALVCCAKISVVLQKIHSARAGAIDIVQPSTPLESKAHRIIWDAGRSLADNALWPSKEPLCWAFSGM
jgi:hypothetical protein